jgi:hypothetical protein
MIFPNFATASAKNWSDRVGAVSEASIFYPVNEPRGEASGSGIVRCLFFSKYHQCSQLNFCGGHSNSERKGRHPIAAGRFQILP